MSEVDPRNPYGRNFEDLDYEQKLYEKFAEVKKFVHFSKQDNLTIARANAITGVGVALAVASFIGVGYALKNGSAFSRFRSLRVIAEEHTKFYYGVFVASSGSLSYYYFNQYYIHQVCKPFMMKYLDQAKLNGFEDYPISETKPFDFHEKFFGAAK